VSVVVSAATIAFRAASGACLKTLVRPADLLAANGRFESTMWTATALGPPLGGAVVGLVGPVATVLLDAVSYLLSAVGIRAIGGSEPPPRRDAAPGRPGAGALLDGWRYLLGHPALRRLFLYTLSINGLIMAAAPLMAVLMLGRLGFPPWQYGLAFGLPCLGGLAGARLARPLVARYGQRRTLVAAGTLGAGWPIWLAFVGPGTPGLLLVIAVELGLLTCMGVFNPVLATYRLEQTATDRVARMLSTWSVTNNLAVAALTALWGLLAGLVGARAAIAAAGLLMLATPLLLPRRDPAAAPDEPRGWPWRRGSRHSPSTGTPRSAHTPSR
jgi:hypothetical protein